MQKKTNTLAKSQFDSPLDEFVAQYELCYLYCILKIWLQTYIHYFLKVLCKSRNDYPNPRDFNTTTARARALSLSRKRLCSTSGTHEAHVRLFASADVRKTAFRQRDFPRRFAFFPLSFSHSFFFFLHGICTPHPSRSVNTMNLITKS